MKVLFSFFLLILLINRIFFIPLFAYLLLIAYLFICLFGYWLFAYLFAYFINLLI
jgi:hypothetical protein